MCKLHITDTRVISGNYMSTEPSVQTVSRGTGHSLQTYAVTAQTLTISTGKDLGLFSDWGDWFQSPWITGQELFDRIGALLNEFIEANVLAQHASWTDFGTADIGGGGASTDPITITASNIDNIIHGVKREVRQANGQSFMATNGLGFVWEASDFELLEEFTQGMGFMTADKALREGIVEGLHYMGVDHYWSNGHTANHVFAAVKQIQELGILKSLYGKAFLIEFPPGDTNEYLSGVSPYSRVDIGHRTPSAHSGLTFDINKVS